MYWTINYDINNLKLYKHVYCVKDINFKPSLKDSLEAFSKKRKCYSNKKRRKNKVFKIIPAIFDKHDLNRTCR